VVTAVTVVTEAAGKVVTTAAGAAVTEAAGKVVTTAAGAAVTKAAGKAAGKVVTTAAGRGGCRTGVDREATSSSGGASTSGTQSFALILTRSRATSATIAMSTVKTTTVISDSRP
jgi:hypothetical protein